VLEITSPVAAVAVRVMGVLRTGQSHIVATSGVIGDLVGGGRLPGPGRDAGSLGQTGEGARRTMARRVVDQDHRRREIGIQVLHEGKRSPEFHLPGRGDPHLGLGHREGEREHLPVGAQLEVAHI
jgi:hypothetical protein